MCIDCARPAALARWWAELLGWRVRAYDEEELARLHAAGIADPEDDPAVAVDPPDPRMPTLWFNAVAESKAGKNRVHLDVIGSLDEVARSGARVLRAAGDDIDWHVLADPEGNEFCLFAPLS
ncbi:MAG TPA: VOC family protein [Mycobacteriales bacterium]|nr:VOC family protein [Mycobacteriales bacterium]